MRGSWLSGTTGNSVPAPAVVLGHLQAVARHVSLQVLQVEQVALRSSGPVVADARVLGKVALTAQRTRPIVDTRPSIWNIGFESGAQ
jgi:hypothetical protein